jgi:shikimate kinase
MKIYLIGMPGSGKTTLGKQLANELTLPFVDLDKEIEKHENKSIAEIFGQDGEVHFRLLESKLLKEWAGSSESFVMATGGGAPCFHDGIEVINKTGLSIFLDVPLADLLARLKSKTDRPLLHTADQKEKEERLASLLNNRLPVYNQAKLLIQKPNIRRVLDALHNVNK